MRHIKCCSNCSVCAWGLKFQTMNISGLQSTHIKVQPIRHGVLFCMDSCPLLGWGQLSIDKVLHTSCCPRRLHLITNFELFRKPSKICQPCLFVSDTYWLMSYQTGQPAWCDTLTTVLQISFVTYHHSNSAVKELPQDSRLNISSEGHKVTIQCLRLDISSCTLSCSGVSQPSSGIQWMDVCHLDVHLLSTWTFTFVWRVNN